MKKAALFFAFFFTVFSILGYLQGRKTRSSPDYLKVELAARMQLQHHLEHDWLVLTPQAGKTAFWYYDLAKRQSGFADPTVLLTVAEQKTRKLPVNGELTASLLGGTTAWKLADVVKALRAKEALSQDRWAVIAGLAGGIVGYGGGYYLGRSSHLPDDAPEVISLLQDPTHLADIKRLVFLMLYRQHQQSLQQQANALTRIDMTGQGEDRKLTLTGQDRTQAAHTAIQQALLRATSRSDDLTQQDFAIFQLLH